ncbi:MAG TPA: fatty acid desaturase [Gemmatimonadaceae bacterium]|nr:fatty acid desaturase [Gemmatimonadaceae bacterium]
MSFEQTPGSAEGTLGDASVRLKRALESLRAFARPDPLRSIWQLVNSAVIFVALWWLALRALDYSYVLALVIASAAAVMVMRLFIVQHDCGHGAFFKSRWANNVVGVVLGVVTLTPYRYWSRQHALHHAGSGNLSERGFGDITTLTVREYLALGWWRRLCYRVYRNPVVLLGLGPAYLFLLKHRFPFDMPLRRWRRELGSVMVTNVAIAAVVGLMAWIVGLERFLLVQLPIHLVFASAGLWMFYVQHQFEDAYWRPNEAWSYEAAGLHGSSYLDLPRFLHWCTGNIGYHHLHHLCPRVPNYYLRRCFEAIPELAPRARLTLWDGMRVLRLRFWDEDTGRLIGFRELRRKRAAGRLRDAA